MSTSQPRESLSPSINSGVVAQPCQATPSVLNYEPAQRLEQAFELGNLLAQLRYFAHQVWLGSRRDPHRKVITELFDRIHFAAGQCVGPKVRRTIQDAIAAFKRQWNQDLKAEWRADARESLQQQCESTADEPELRSQIEMHASHVTDLMEGFHKQILPMLSITLQRVVDFGTAVADGEHRPDVVWCMLECPRINCQPPIFRRASLGTPPVVQLPAAPWHYWKFFERGQLPAPKFWLRELQARWQECGLTGLDDAATSLDVDRPGSVNEKIERIESAFHAAVRQAESQKVQIEPQPPGYLDLVLDETRGQVSREGYGERVQLTPLKISIMKLLLRNGETLTNPDMLKRIWNAPEGADPSDGAVHNEISELRKALAPLGVEIPNRRKLGWRLQDKDSAEKVAPKTGTSKAKRKRRNSVDNRQPPGQQKVAVQTERVCHSP